VSGSVIGRRGVEREFVPCPYSKTGAAHTIEFPRVGSLGPESRRRVRSEAAFKPPSPHTQTRTPRCTAGRSPKRPPHRDSEGDLDAA